MFSAKDGTRDTLASVNYIIDGHNLIAHIPGLSLEMLNDEERLIQLLNQYGEKQRGKLEVFFDGAPIGQAGEQSYGRVWAKFVTQKNTADEAIRARLAKLGKSARSWKVVSSDRSVQAAAREHHSGVVKAEDFTSQLLDTLKGKTGETENIMGQPLSSEEVDEWLTLFKRRKPTK